MGENTGPDATGGGVSITNGSNPIIQFCRIRENSSIRGAGITIHSSNPIIKNCWIRNNEVTGNFEDNFGGGIFATFSEFTFQNLFFSENYFLTEYSPCLNSENPQNIASNMGIYVDEDGFFCMGLNSGDLNDDSLINIIALIILADCIIHLNCPSGNGCEFWHYNVNEDNEINVLDIMGLVISIIGEE